MLTVSARPAAAGWAGGELSRVRARLARPVIGNPVVGWVGPLLVTAVAAVLRFTSLSSPKGLVFDEVYYAHDSWNLLQHGVELNKDNTAAGFVVHPPLGKWMIAFGEWVFGNHELGWRFAAALVGTLSVLLLARIGRRLFGSTLLGSLAGLFLALDGLEFVQSRVSMLDIFLMFWVLASFGCLLLDRDDGRRRLAARLQLTTDRDGFGPFLGFRWWRLAAGICAGAAIATKWTGFYDLPAILLLAYWWDVQARRTAGIRRPYRAALVADGLFAFVPLVLVPAVVYVLSWLGWFMGDQLAWDHDRYLRPHQSTWAHFWAVVHGWLTYHREIWDFHTQLNAGHPYRSDPWGWLLLARPVAYFYGSPGRRQGCHVSLCSREVLGIGTPTLWWAAIPALLFLIWWAVGRRDWRAGAILVMFFVNYLPWFATPGRTMFLFYLLPGVPFMVLAMTMCLGIALGGPKVSQLRRVSSSIYVGVYVLLVVLNFFYLYPILTARTIPYASWHQRMWFTSCTNGNQKHETAPCWI